MEAIARRLNGVPASTTLEGCLTDLEAFRGGVPREDDLTLMTVRRVENDA